MTTLIRSGRWFADELDAVAYLLDDLILELQNEPAPQLWKVRRVLNFRRTFRLIDDQIRRYLTVEQVKFVRLTSVANLAPSVHGRGVRVIQNTHWIGLFEVEPEIPSGAPSLIFARSFQARNFSAVSDFEYDLRQRLR